MSFKREDCEYTRFNIENHKIGFAICGNEDEGILISVPFAEDTPQCIKDKLNDIIYQEMNKYLETVRCMSMPCCLRLDARMQIQYSGDGSDPKYYISMVITDIPEIEAGTWIDRSDDISPETTELQNEFTAYCQYKLNKILFPIK